MPYWLSQLLTISAQCHPDNVAVQFKDRQLTYRDLDSLSNQVAQRLVDAGVGRGDRVGIYLDKSLEAMGSFCAERIPKYMIPHLFEFYEALPKTSTGKVDKTRLHQEAS